MYGPQNVKVVKKLKWFHKMQGVSVLAEEMLGFQGVCSKGLLRLGDIAWRHRSG